jgi:hypothetical protein
MRLLMRLRRNEDKRIEQTAKDARNAEKGFVEPNLSYETPHPCLLRHFL